MDIPNMFSLACLDGDLKSGASVADLIPTMGLKRDYINDAVFSMNGKRRRLEKMVPPVVPGEYANEPEIPPTNGNDSPSLESNDPAEKNQGNILSFSKRKNRKDFQE